MKKYITTLLLAAAVSIHAQAADLESQLSGYWQPDMPKTLALAKKQNREIDPFTAAIMGKLIFEFQNGKMTVHGPSGDSGENPPIPYTVNGVGQAKNSLILSAGGTEVEARFDEGQLALNDPDTGWTIFNRMSKEDFAKREVGNAAPEDDAPAAGKPEDVPGQPISGDPAAGKVNGKEFKVEKATLNLGMGTLRLQQGEGYFGDMQFTVFLFDFLFDEGKNEVDGKTITVKPNQDSSTAHIHMGYKVEGKSLPETEIHTKKYTMSLEFGTAKDGKIPGKINLRLPDEAGSFVVGSFEAEIE